MVEIADIKDRDSLKAWLKDQPREVSVWIASRAAARVLPLWWRAVLIKDWARDRDLTALPVLRSLLISSVGATVSTEDMKAARVANAGAAMAYTNTHMGHAFAATDAAAKVAPYAAANAAANAAVANVADAVSDAAAAATDAGSNAAAAAARSVWNAVRIDAEQVSGGEILRFLPLWADATNPLAKMWQEVQAEVETSETADDWTFWIAWYQSLLDSRPMLGDGDRTWEMLAKIALIEPEVWDQGAEVVNPVINEIWDLFRLRIEAEELRAQKEAFLAARATPEQRSHNQPPGLVEAEPEIARQVAIIWAGLDEASEELAAKEPDKERLTQIAKGMLAALRAVAAYCGKLADRVVEAAASVIGAGAGTALLDRVANNGRLMQFAKDLLTWSAGGG